MLFAIVLCVALLVLEREELGLITVFSILGCLAVAGTSLLFLSPLFFGVIVVGLDIYLVIRLYGDVAIR
jgi:hypothetical protein